MIRFMRRSFICLFLAGIGTAGLALQNQEQEVANAYRAFLRAQQQKKIMEKLRERRQAQYKEEFRKHEGRAQDEQYVTRARLAETQEESNEE